MADLTGQIDLLVKVVTEAESDRPTTPDGTIVQYATEKGIVYQSDNGGYIWYNDFPQIVSINFQEDPLAFEQDRDITNAINLRENIGAPNNTIYYCDVDIYGYDDGSTATSTLAFDLYAEVDGGLVSGYHYTCVVLKNRSFRLTARIKFEADPGDQFRLFATVVDGDFDAIYIQGGTCELRRAHWYD